MSKQKKKRTTGAEIANVLCETASHEYHGLGLGILGDRVDRFVPESAWIGASDAD